MSFIYRSKYGIKTALLLVCFAGFALAQSTDQNFPTSVTTSQIVGSIKARDIGDPRATSYYYAFGGTQGDVFINVVTKNFVGDIDVFAQDGLRPLTKIVVFDRGLNETGRLIYLRKEERLLLRVQGRTPDDEAASFQIKFAGSFVALQPAKDEAPPTISSAGEDSTVNSVGTRVPPKPVDNRPDRIAEIPAKPPVETKPQPAAPVEKKVSRPEVIVGSTIKPPVNITAKPKAESAKPSANEKKPAKGKAPDPLASIRLMVLLRDGSVIERPLNEVQKFTVEKGVLLVTLKDGNLSRFPMVDVVRVTIE